MTLTCSGRNSSFAARYGTAVAVACAALVAGNGIAAADRPEVKARLVVPPRVAPGGTGTIAVEMTLGPGWHVNSHKTTLRYLIPTTVTLTTSSGTLSDVRYPKHVERRFDFIDVPIAVYEGTVRFESDITVPEGAGGRIDVNAVVAFQACDDRQCFQPARTTLSGSVAVAGSISGER